MSHFLGGIGMYLLACLGRQLPAFLYVAVVSFAQVSSVPGTPAVSSQSPVTGEQPIGEKDNPQLLAPLIDELVENNPDIRAARYRAEAAMARPSQVSTLPDPRLSYTDFGVGHPFSTLGVSNFAYRGFGVAQEVPFPGKLALAGEEARKEAQSEGQMYRTTLLDRTSRLKVAYYEWFSVAKSIEVTNRNRDLLERFEKIARARYAVGKGIQADVLRAQVEVSRLVQQLAVLEQRRKSAEAQINALLNRSQTTPFGDPPNLKVSHLEYGLESLLSLVQQTSPQLRSKELLVESRAVGVNRAKLEYRPDFNFSFQWQRTALQFPDYYMAVAEVKLPIYFSRKQRYGVEEAAARLQEARHNVRSTQQELLFTAKDQYLIATTSEKLLSLYEAGVIPQSSLALESTLSAYEVGNADFLSLINSVSTLLGFEMQYYEELAKHEQALARLEPLIGRTLIQ